MYIWYRDQDVLISALSLVSLSFSPSLCTASLGGVRTLARNSQTRLHVYLTGIHEPSIDLKSVLCHAGLAVGRGEVAKHAEFLVCLVHLPTQQSIASPTTLQLADLGGIDRKSDCCTRLVTP